jgi:hypothetical protein
LITDLARWSDHVEQNVAQNSISECLNAVLIPIPETTGGFGMIVQSSEAATGLPVSGPTAEVSRYTIGCIVRLHDRPLGCGHVYTIRI